MRNKIYTGFIIVLLCSAIHLQAQQTSNSEIIVKLTSTPVNNTFPLPISSIRIITKLPDSTTLGYVRSPWGNETIKILPESNVTNWLQSYVNKQYGSLFSINGNRALWTIRDMSIGRDSAAINTFIRLQASIYVGFKDKQLQLIQNVDTVFTIQQTNDNNAAAITKAIQYFFNISATESSVLPGNTAYLTEDSIALQTTAQASWPIFKDTIYQQGVYTNFDEFKNNNPSIKKPSIQIDSKDSNKIKVCQAQSDGTIKEIPSVWGISIAGELYLYKNGTLIPIEKSGNAIVVSRFQDFMIRKNRALYYRKVIGSLNGDINPYSRAHYYQVDNKEMASFPNPPEATKIDLKIGALSF